MPNPNSFKPLSFFALILPTVTPQLAVATDTDVTTSNNAGFSPYLLQAELQPSDHDQLFGIATSISGGHAAVLIQQDFADTIGTLSLFDETPDGSTWRENDRAVVNNGRSLSEGPNDYQSCFSIASNGDHVALAEPTMTILESNPGQGGVSFFRRSLPHWIYDGLIVDPIPDEGQFFGCSVAISGTTAAIGAPWASSGAIFIANFDGSVWSLVQKITPPADSPSYFGSSVGISGDRIVVSAPGDGPYGVDKRAVAYVFDRRNGRWEMSAEIAASNTKVGDDFAHSVAVDGDTIVVGARGKNQNACAVYIYQSDAGSWRLTDEFQESFLPGRSPNFGFALSLQGGRLLAGEPVSRGRTCFSKKVRSGCLATASPRKVSIHNSDLASLCRGKNSL
jgi:hypothetical protein